MERDSSKEGEPDLRDLVGRAFKPAELAYLERVPEFARAAASMRTLAEFEELCGIGEQLLLQHSRFAESDRSRAQLNAAGLPEAAGSNQ